MKKTYKSPIAKELDIDKSLFPAVALAGGYAIGRAVTRAMEIRSLKACLSLPKNNQFTQDSLVTN